MDTENLKLVPVEGHNNLFRDKDTGAILNKDRSSYMNYMRMKQIKQNERDEIDEIKKDIEEIKCLLKEFINESRQN